MGYCLISTLPPPPPPLRLIFWGGGPCPLTSLHAGCTIAPPQFYLSIILPPSSIFLNEALPKYSVALVHEFFLQGHHPECLWYLPILGCQLWRTHCNCCCCDPSCSSETIQHFCWSHCIQSYMLRFVVMNYTSCVCMLHILV